jgi:pimeloyl-ACP methyl ester carboxylesterase
VDRRKKLSPTIPRSVDRRFSIILIKNSRDNPMVLDFPVRVWKGAEGKPILILIHGFGATEKSWTNPYEESLVKGRISFDYVLANFEERPSPPYFAPRQFRRYCFSTPLGKLTSRPPSLWGTLKRRGYSLLTWTQREPYGSIDLAVEELNGMVVESEAIFGIGARLVLIGHSRGGLVARKWVQDHPDKRKRVHGLILLASPNGGSRLADAGEFFARGIKAIGRFIPRDLSLECGGILRLSQGVALEELRPNAPFILGLKQKEVEEQRSHIPYLNLVATSTVFTKLYRISKKDTGEAREVLSLIDSLPKIVPAMMLPHELVQGKGDGLVSKERARIAWVPSESQKEFHINHLRVLIDRDVRREITRFLEAPH